MLLLFTLLSKSKNNLLLTYDTKNKKGSLINVNIKHMIHTSGIVYSGSYLIVSVKRKNKNDIIIFFDLYKDEYKLYECNNSKNIGSIISIYPGIIYLDSQDTNSINSIDFDPVNLFHFDDSIHYIFKQSDICIKSLCNYKNNWFVILNNTNQIFDLTNNRIVYSDINNSNCLFFNSNHRLCFLESGNNLFHCGDDIFKIDKKSNCAIEDINENGYWIVCGTNLIFITNEGDITDRHDLSKFGKEFMNCVEARGRFLI